MTRSDRRQADASGHLIATPELIEWRHLSARPLDGGRPHLHELWRELFLLGVLAGVWALCLHAGAADFAARERLAERLTVFDPGWAQSMRQAFADVLRQVQERSPVSAEAAGLVGGIAVGVTAVLPASTDEHMLVTGLAHITAVSGANVAILVGIVQVFLARSGVSPMLRPFAELIAVWCFVLIVGGEVTVLRAAVMLSLVIVLRPWSGGRGIGGLSIAVVTTLIWDPDLAGSAGFALSVSATAGLLLFSAPVCRWLRRFMPELMASLIGPTVAALVACQPVLLLIDGSPASVHHVAANLLALPAVPLVTVLGVLACLSAFWAPPLSGLLVVLATPATWWIGQVAEYFAERPFGEIPWPPWPLGGYSALIVIGLLGVAGLLGAAGDDSMPSTRFGPRPARQRIRLLAGIAAGLIAAITSIAHTGSTVIASAGLPQHTAVVQCNVGQGDGMLLRIAEVSVLIDTGQEAEGVTTCLREAGVSKLDAVVLTHSDIDHVGAVDAVSSVASVRSVLVPDVLDAKLDQAVERLHADQVMRSSRGDRGTIGSGSQQIRWQTLHPERPVSPPAAAPIHLGGMRADASMPDPNASSLTMLIQVGGLRLLALADLGETEQRAVVRELDALDVQRVDVVKVAHHGSGDHWPQLYTRLQPAVAVISCGIGNRYGHPAARLLESIGRSGARVLRTDLHGRIALDIVQRDTAADDDTGANESRQQLGVWCEHAC